MVKLQVKDEKVKYEIPDDFMSFRTKDNKDDFDWLYKSYDLTIKYNIANEMAELNRNLGMIKIALMNISSTQKQRHYERS